MYTSSSCITAIVFAFLMLLKSIASAPQYFLDSCFYPMPLKENLVYLTPSRGHDWNEIRGNYPVGLHPMNYLGSNSWFAPGQSLGMSLVPPIREESEFKFFGPEIETGGNRLHRGRSDIDPIEDNEGLGYFYPKPKITFDLPVFRPLGNAEEAVPQDVTVATTTTEEITDKITTVPAPETSSVKV